jgi:hypothetical protein
VNDKVYILFLPEYEIHQLGLLFMQYELILKGYKAIYLGERVPVNSLEVLHDLYDNVTYVSYFTVYPSVEKLESYLENFNEKYLKNGNRLIVGGRNAIQADLKDLKNISVFSNFSSLLKSI